MEFDAVDCFYLSIRDDAVVASRLHSAEPGIVITSVEQLRGLLAERNEDSFMCSSSMDFPEDCTSNKSTIDLARAIRG